MPSMLSDIISHVFLMSLYETQLFSSLNICLPMVKCGEVATDLAE